MLRLLLPGFLIWCAVDCELLRFVDLLELLVVCVG